MSEGHVGFVEGGHAVLFCRESRRTSLFTRSVWFERASFARKGRHTTVIAGHRMPERSKSRAETVERSIVSYAALYFA